MRVAHGIRAIVLSHFAEQEIAPRRVARPGDATRRGGRDGRAGGDDAIGNEGRKAEITFPEACGFWGVSEAMKGDAVKARLDHLRAELSGLERLLTIGDSTLSNGRSVSLADLNRLHDVNGYLEERFGRHLNLLRSRAAKP